MRNAFLNEHETKVALADFILKAPKLSMDSQCLKFEKEFSKFQNCKDSILFNSGGSANLAILQALRNMGILNEGDKIGFSSLTWSTNVMPIIQMNMVPVPIDVDVHTLNSMSYHLEERIKQEILDAFFITNALGFSGNLDEIKRICNDNNIILIEDNCESLGTELESGKTGNFGIASSFSFYVAHHMSTIEGGMVCVNNNKLAEMLRIVRANGWDRNLTSEQQIQLRKKFNIKSEFESKYSFYDLGYNMRPTEITGFLGLYQLQFIKENIEKRENNFLFLEKFVENNPDLIVPNHSHISRLSSFAFPILCKNSQLKKRYFSKFSGENVEIRPMIAGNIQKQPFYKKYVPNTYDLPGAEFIHNCGFYCGNYPELTHKELELISSCLMKY